MKTVQTRAGFSIKHPIVDVETKNVIPFINGTKKLDYCKGEISVAGFFVDDMITQFMIVDESKLDKFRNQIREFLSTIDGKQPHAFNTNMEIGCFKRI